MNPDDRQLIGGMFERIQNVQGFQKDTDAEAFIHECMRQNPDSPYLLVQSVLVQEQALQKADERLKELEAKVLELQKQAAATQPNNKSSFAGPRSSAGFGGNSRPQSAVPAAGQAPWQSAPNQNEQRPGAGQQPSAGGGFMAQAMTTAAGVAGGMLLASGISSLFSGSSGVAEAATPTETAAADTQAPATEQQATDTSQAADAPQEDAAVQDASHDDGGGLFGDWGGGDDSWGGDGGDFEI